MMSPKQELAPEMIKSRLTGLSRRHAVAFSAACCERILPNYQVFSQAEDWGDYPLLRTALDEAWRYAQGAPVSAEHLKALLVRCDAVIPDTEDFGTLWCSHALDAGVAICATLELCMDGDLEHVENVVTAACDTVDMFIQARDDMDYNDPEFEAKILADALMAREVQRQIDDLEALAQQPTLTVNLVTSIRERYYGQSNIA